MFADSGYNCLLEIQEKNMVGNLDGFGLRVVCVSAGGNVLSSWQQGESLELYLQSFGKGSSKDTVSGQVVRVGG